MKAGLGIDEVMKRKFVEVRQHIFAEVQGRFVTAIMTEVHRPVSRILDILWISIGVAGVAGPITCGNQPYPSALSTSQSM